MNNSKVRLAVAVSDRSKFDVETTHVTTTDFFRLTPVYYQHLVPSSKLHLNLQEFCRLEPLAVPTFGRCRVNVRGFFVPFRTLVNDGIFDSFINDTVAYSPADGNSGLVSSLPYIRWYTLWNVFVTASNGLFTAGSAASHDFEISGSYYNLTSKGVRYLQILESLGYRLIPAVSKDTGKYSALALLALAKIYLDWYVVSQYTDSSAYQTINALLHKSEKSGYDFTASDVIAILNLVAYANYDSDNLFVAAWDNPVAPTSGLYSSTSIVDHTISDGSQVSTDSTTGSPVVGVQDDVFSQYGIDVLKSMSDYLKRHQLVGGQNIDRALAQFGVQLSAEKMKRSVYIGFNSFDVNIGDVFGTSDNNLAQYSGRGYSQGSHQFDVETDEFGIFMILASLIPDTNYYQNIDRNNLHLDKLDFFNPEFDSLGCQAITKGEVFVSGKGSFTTNNSALYASGFGWAPRYYEYKTFNSHVTGFLRQNAVVAGTDSWHLFRHFEDAKFGGVSGLVHSLDFCRGSLDHSQYDRIFAYTGSTRDNFTMIFKFDGTTHAPMKSLFDSYDFKDADKAKQITTNSQGVKVN